MGGGWETSKASAHPQGSGLAQQISARSVPELKEQDTWSHGEHVPASEHNGAAEGLQGRVRVPSLILSGLTHEKLLTVAALGTGLGVWVGGNLLFIGFPSDFFSP